MRTRFIPFLVMAAILFAGAALAQNSPAKIGYHAVRVDNAGHIVPWYGSGPPEGYDHVIRAVWNFWINMRECPNGVPYYMQHQVWKPGEDDPRGLGGDQINMALDSWQLLYAYLGDPAVRKNMVFMADYWLANGMSPAGVKWPNLPFPYNLEPHSGRYDGDMRAGKGYLQPDKAATFGAELVRLYKMTGDEKYLKAAEGIADALAARIQPGDNDNSPWPYRVNATTGEVHSVTDKGQTFRASYTSNYTGALRLFDSLAEMRRGKTKDYEHARAVLVAWLKAHPIKTNKWGPFFEDIPTQNWSDTETNADTLAWYILEHPAWDPQWKQQAAAILAWSDATFTNNEYEKYGVWPINEQTAYKVPGNSHTSHHASVELLYCEKTGDIARKEQAIRRLNWATYMVDEDGKNRYPRDDNWLTDGYGDYVRYYLRAMASFPELAPDNQNHLLRTTSVIQSIEYAPERISYQKYDARSEERLKLGAWKPGRCEGGRMSWDAATKTVTIRAVQKKVTIYAAK